MSSLTTNNMVELTATPKAGQRVVLIDGKWVTTGLGSAASSPSIDVSGVTATLDDVLEGKMFVKADGTLALGTISVTDGGTFNPGTMPLVFDGYIDGMATVPGLPSFMPSNIKAGVTLWNVTGTYEGDGADISDATAFSQNVVEGLVFYGVNGRLIGSMPLGTSDTLYVYNGLLYTDQTSYIGAATSIPLSRFDTTATPLDIVSGKTAYINGGKVLGIVQSLRASDINIADNKMYIPAIAYVNAAQFDLDNISGIGDLAALNIILGKTICGVAGSYKAPLASAGLLIYKCALLVGGQAGYQVANCGNTLLNGIYTLKSTNSGSNSYSVYENLVGSQLIIYDDWGYMAPHFMRANPDNSDLPEYQMPVWSALSWSTAGDITSITEWDNLGSGTAPTPTITTAAGAPTGWKGYKYDTDTKEFSETLTEGLEYKMAAPIVGKCYNADATMLIDLYAPSGLVFYAPLHEEQATDETGKVLNYDGTQTFAVVDGVSCMKFTNTYLYTESDDLPDSSSSRTFSFLVYRTRENNNHGVCLHMGDNGGTYYCHMLDLKDGVICFENSNGSSYSGVDCVDNSSQVFIHCALTYDKSSKKIIGYQNGIVKAESVMNDDFYSLKTIGIGNINSGGSRPFGGYMAEVKIWNRALSAEEIKAEADRCLAMIDVGGSPTITFDGIYDAGGNKVDTMTFKYGTAASYTLRATASNGSTCTFAWASEMLSAPPCLNINSNGTVSTSNFDISADITKSYPFKISADGCEDLTVDIPFTFQSCVHPDSLILMADGTEKAIKDVLVGLSVMSINQETGELESDIVLKNLYTEQCSYPTQDKWIFDDGTELITLARHRIFNVDRGAFVYMDEWCIGEHARKVDGSVTALVAHEVIEQPEVMCTIRLTNNTYVVNGLLTGTREAKAITPFDNKVTEI